MIYSPSVGGVFCKHCALMLSKHCRKDKGAFVNKPFINWHKLQEKAKRHEQMKYHHNAMIATESFLNSIEEFGRGNQGCQALQYNDGRGN